jgi:hypothetical protein
MTDVSLINDFEKPLIVYRAEVHDVNQPNSHLY